MKNFENAVISKYGISRCTYWKMNQKKDTLKGMEKYSNKFVEYRIPLRKVVKKEKSLVKR